MGGCASQQRVADRAHVDRARIASAQQVGALQRRAVDVEGAAARQQQAAGRIAPVAGQRRQAGDRAHRVAAAARALHAVVQADGARPHVPVVVRQPFDDAGADAADGRDPLRVVAQRALGQRVEAERVAVDIVAVEPAFADQDVHDAEGQRPVGPRQRRNVLVAALGRQRAVRIDGDQARAAPLGLLRPAPQVQVGGHRIAAPEDDLAAVLELLHVHADAGAQRVAQPEGAGLGADGAVEAAGAEPVEEALRHRLALHQTHRSGVAVRNDGLRIARRDGAQPHRDLVDRPVPGHRLEAAGALAADAPQRRQHAVGVVAAFQVAADLGAQRAAGGRMVRVAGNAHGDAPPGPGLHGDLHGAGIGAVVRTGGQDDFRRRSGRRAGAGHCFAHIRRHGRFSPIGAPPATACVRPRRGGFRT